MAGQYRSKNIVIVKIFWKILEKIRWWCSSYRKIEGLNLLFSRKSKFSHQSFPRYRSSHRSCSLRKDVLRNFAKFTKNTCARVSFLINFATLLKKGPWHRSFPVNFAKFLRALFFTEHLWATAPVGALLKYQKQLLLRKIGKYRF